MSVNFDPRVETVLTNGVLYASKTAVRNLAIMLVANSTEANVDMILDFPEEYATKKEIDTVFANNTVDSALTTVDDFLADLGMKVKEYLKSARITATVRRLDYDAEGKMKDITVDITAV